MLVELLLAASLSCSPSPPGPASRPERAALGGSCQSLLGMAEMPTRSRSIAGDKNLAFAGM
jgi:hypothetical protein